ncbi:DNA polymerase III subunit gamma and tau [Actinoplanes utahensis]|uniref:DNA polymerase III subunit gamma/tau n=1 Tax=Actinoplanes utahensis TaxID=1869 RepID=A0A0A6U8K5_ACTUT|nr:DNA polymerase III subunit gamma and tau [Actinoplanes utahensis]KHD72370.1 hypothetical protein MB27_38485 [Actinoplanes utahensis]GIF29556.1 hypothetical protein Aut01nite_25420 [Actinoplanes utahensis]
MALALYRKYRPRTFAEVIGQEHVTEPLSQALRSGRINHAYLFSGPRGCGKTSSARILARSLNCEQGPTPEPCGVCGSCKSLAIDGAGSIDVIEIDAASHGGVDDARELREKAFFAPANSRYKIYVIDEAHMVSSAGFNALLKLVEEPPDYVRFIFATTEPDKVLGTIRSRTHHYPFRLIPPAVLRPYLQQLTDAEGVTVEPSVFPLVVRAGGGSARDTLSILDQLIAGSGPAGVTYSSAVGLLGVTDAALIDEMCDALAEGDGAAAYATIDRVAEAGHEPRRFASDLLERFRDLIILQQVPDAVAKGLIDGPADQLEAMAAQAGRLGAATLSRCADILHNGLVEMRGTTAPRLLLELVTARMLLPGADSSAAALLQRLERLERGVTLAPSAAGPAQTSDVRGEHPPVAPAVEAPRGPAGADAGAAGGGGGAAKAAAMAAARAAAGGRSAGLGAARPVSPAAQPSPVVSTSPVAPAAQAVAPSSALAPPSTASSPSAGGSPAASSPSAGASPAASSPAAGAARAEGEPDWNRVAEGNDPVEAGYYDDEPPPWDEDPPEAAGPPEPVRRAPARPEPTRPGPAGAEQPAHPDSPRPGSTSVVPDRIQPGGSESARSEPADVVPARAQAGGSDFVRPESRGVVPGRGQAAGADFVRPELMGAESGRGQAGGSEAVGAEQVQRDGRLEQIRTAWQVLGQRQPKVKAMQDYGIGVREVDGNTVMFTAPTQAGVDRFLTWADAIAGEFRKSPGGVWRIRCEVGSPDARGGGRLGASTDRRDQSADRRVASSAPNRAAPTSAASTASAPERNTGRTESRPSRPQRAPAADADEDWPAAARPATGIDRSEHRGHSSAGRSAEEHGRSGAAAVVGDSGWPEPAAPGGRSAPAQEGDTGNGWPEPVSPGNPSTAGAAPHGGRPASISPDARPVGEGQRDVGGDDWPEPAVPGDRAPADQGQPDEADWPEPVRPAGPGAVDQASAPERVAGPETEAGSEWPEPVRPGGAAADPARTGDGSVRLDPARPEVSEQDGSDWPEPVRPGASAQGGSDRAGPRGSEAAAESGSDWPEPVRPGSAAVGGSLAASEAAVGRQAGSPVAPGPAGAGDPAAPGKGPAIGGGAGVGGGSGLSTGPGIGAGSARSAGSGAGGGPGSGGGSGLAAGSAFGGAAVAAAPRDSASPAAPARSAAMEAARAAARTGLGGSASGGGAAAARAALASARNAGGQAPGGAAGRPAGTTWSDGSPVEEAPYDPEYDGPAPPSGTAYEGFDPGDEPLDVVIDEKTARQSSEEQAIQLLREAFGAEKIAEL